MNTIARLRSLSPWTIIGAIVLAWLFFGMTLAILLLTRPDQHQAAPGAAVISVIHAPTDTPMPTPLPPEPSATALPPEGVIYVGGYAQVIGTGGSGLRLRYAPGLAGQIRLLAAEGEVFQVLDGPQQVDDYTWWYLENPDDQARKGWAVANFLQAHPAP